MEKFIVEGGYPLCGVADVQGAKNSVLPIMAASLVCDGECIIENCPRITDTDAAIEILRELGAVVTVHNDYITVNPAYAVRYEIPDRLMRKMRSSIMFLGAILTRSGRALVSFPGGCELGQRPIDLHLAALSAMGVKIEESYGFLDCYTDGLKGCEITLSFPSVGATENIMLAAVKAKGITVINNPAKEPEIEDLQNFLCKMGAKISGAGTNRIVIEGVKILNGVKHRVIPDRVAAATYLFAVAATRGNALIRKCCPQHLSTVTALLRDAGCEVDVLDSTISIECDRLRSLRVVRTMPYPGFPTDMQAPLMALMCVAKGSTVFIETIFESRYKHVGELVRMGAKITTEGRVAVVEGVPHLKSAAVEATDLRGGAALMIAGLAAEGETVISNLHHIKRGYECPEKILSSLGAKIRIENS